MGRLSLTTTYLSLMQSLSRIGSVVSCLHTMHTAKPESPLCTIRYWDLQGLGVLGSRRVPTATLTALHKFFTSHFVTAPPHTRSLSTVLAMASNFVCSCSPGMIPSKYAPKSVSLGLRGDEAGFHAMAKVVAALAPGGCLESAVMRDISCGTATSIVLHQGICRLCKHVQAWGMSVGQRCGPQWGGGRAYSAICDGAPSSTFEHNHTRWFSLRGLIYLGCGFGLHTSSRTIVALVDIVPLL